MYTVWPLLNKAGSFQQLDLQQQFLLNSEIGDTNLTIGESLFGDGMAILVLSNVSNGPNVCLKI